MSTDNQFQAAVGAELLREKLQSNRTPATVCRFELLYGDSLVTEYFFACCDGGRVFVPFPASREDLVITREQYAVAGVVNGPGLRRPLADYLGTVGIKIQDGAGIQAVV